MRNEAMTAAKPMAMLAMAILWMVDEKPPSCPRLILFEMKYERFNLLVT